MLHNAVEKMMEVEKVMVDGVDVTQRCFSFDDEQGWADCYVWDSTGKSFLVGEPPEHIPVVEHLTGKVTFVPRVKELKG